MVGFGKNVRGASLFAPPKTLTGKKFKAPTLKIPMGGSPFMMQIRGFQAAGRAFHYDMLPKKTMEKVHKGMVKVAGRILKTSQKLCPVGVYPASSGRIGGRLRASGRVVDMSKVIPNTESKVQFLDIHIVYGGAQYNVEYAVYVHEGHEAPDGSWVRGNPFLVRAARRHKKDVLRACKYNCMEIWNKFVAQINKESTWVTASGSQVIGHGFKASTAFNR